MIFQKSIEKLYRKNLYSRCDDSGTVFYFSASDFDGLRSDKYSFTSKRGNKLIGAFYYYDNYDPTRLVVFDHGMGGGHRAYMREIEMLCRHGYRVFAYDHTGCMESGGESTNGFAQSLSDLDDCLLAFKSNESCKNLDISVMGHSWGGFSTLNISALHPYLSHTVVLSGFISVKAMVNATFSGVLKPYRKCIYKMEESSNPGFVEYNALDTIAKTSAKSLLIYSDNDPLVSRAAHFDPLKEASKNNPNVRLIFTSGKGHNPNYTYDALKYKDNFFKELQRKTKKKQLATPEQRTAFVSSYDWKRMTEQDPSVWSEIFSCLDS